MPLAESISVLATRWRSAGIELLPPATPALIREVFERVGSKATGDVVALYQALGGMADMDREYWRLWSLQEIKKANVRSTDAGVLFSDYLLDCYRFRLKRLNDSTSEVWVDFGRPVRVAGSLEEFFASYIANPDAVLDAPSPE